MSAAPPRSACALLPRSAWERLEFEAPAGLDLTRFAAHPIDGADDWLLLSFAGADDAPSLQEGAVAHHQALVELSDACPLIPLRYRPDRSVEQVLRIVAADPERLGSLWRDLAGRVEIGVRLEAVPRETDSEREAVDAAQVAADRPESGRAYLQRRAERRRRADDATRARHERFRTFHRALRESLGELAFDDRCVLRDPVRGSAGSYSGSFLVERRRAHDAHLVADALVATLDGPAQGFGSANLLGPWPPYSFTLDIAAAGSPESAPAPQEDVP